MIALLGAFAPALLSVLGFFLDKAAASAQTKKAFFNMVETMGREGLVSVKLTLSYQEQRKQLEKDMGQ